MVIGLSIMSFISFLWFYWESAKTGWFGVRSQRYALHGSKDKIESERLLHVLERYEIGELTAQLSRYNDNLLFTKVLNNESTGVEYDSHRIYVQIHNPFDKCFGWLEDEPRHVNHYLYDSVCGGRAAISHEAWERLMKLRNILLEEHSENSPIRKRKNEEVILS